MQNNWMPALLTLILVATAVFAIIQLSRGRMRRRWKTLLDAYAEQESRQPAASRRR